MTVVLFRARNEAEASARRLAARGVAAACAPVTALVATGADAPPGVFDFAIATSAQALSFATPGLLAAARALPLHVVGARTHAAAAAAGIAAEDPTPDIAALLPRLPGGRALYLAGRDRKPELEAALGARVTVVEVYLAQARAGWDEAETQAVAQARAALHYSERSAELAAAFADKAGLTLSFRRLAHVCLSRAVAGKLAATGAARILWPREPTQEALFDTLETALAEYG